MINQTSAVLALSRMMGKRIVPTGDNLDWKDYVQTAFDYAWRYFPWDWSLRTAVVDMDTDPYLPADFDLGGYREAVGGVDTQWQELNQVDFARNTGGYFFRLEYDTAVNRYKVYTNSGSSTITFVYQVTPPTLEEDVDVPFPSAMTIGIGASIYAKQGENPTRANIDQEWDEFHHELDRHVGRVQQNVPRAQNRNLQDYHGTYTGDVR